MGQNGLQMAQNRPHPGRKKPLENSFFIVAEGPSRLLGHTAHGGTLGSCDGLWPLVRVQLLYQLCCGMGAAVSRSREYYRYLLL
jgi:hypothetical protein